MESIPFEKYDDAGSSFRRRDSPSVAVVRDRNAAIYSSNLGQAALQRDLA